MHKKRFSYHINMLAGAHAKSLIAESAATIVLIKGNTFH